MNFPTAHKVLIETMSFTLGCPKVKVQCPGRKCKVAKEEKINEVFVGFKNK